MTLLMRFFCFVGLTALFDYKGRIIDMDISISHDLSISFK